MDWGSVADWVGAVGTIATVIITLQKLREPLLFSVYELYSKSSAYMAK